MIQENHTNVTGGDHPVIVLLRDALHQSHIRWPFLIEEFLQLSKLGAIPNNQEKCLRIINLGF